MSGIVMREGLLGVIWSREREILEQFRGRSMGTM